MKLKLNLIKILWVVLLALSFSGCATGDKFENRLTCTANGDTAIVASKWQFFYIGTELSEKDRPFICPKKTNPEEKK